MSQPNGSPLVFEKRPIRRACGSYKQSLFGRETSTYPDSWIGSDQPGLGETGRALPLPRFAIEGLPACSISAGALLPLAPSIVFAARDKLEEQFFCVSGFCRKLSRRS